jgi:hypothetical protein
MDELLTLAIINTALENEDIERFINQEKRKLTFIEKQKFNATLEHHTPIEIENPIDVFYMFALTTTMNKRYVRWLFLDSYKDKMPETWRHVFNEWFIFLIEVVDAPIHFFEDELDELESKFRDNL